MVDTRSGGKSLILMAGSRQLPTEVKRLFSGSESNNTAEGNKDSPAVTNGVNR